MHPSNSETLCRDDTVLVFGMEWFPLLGDHVEAQARTLARQRGATHRVVCSGAAAAVGLWRGRFRRAGKRQHCSAAAAFAGLHPSGTVAAIVPLPAEQYWLVAVHEGAVMTRTDQLYVESSSLEDAILMLRSAHPGLILHDETSMPSELMERLLDMAKSKGELVRTARFARMSPLALLAVSLLLAGGLATALGLGPLSRPAPDAGASPADAVSAWTHAIALSAAQHTVHGVAGLRALLDTVHATPIGVAGWLLQEVQCRPRADRWLCRARYRREGDGDNLGFIAAAPSDWTVTFDPLNGLEASWSVTMPAQPLNTVVVRRATKNEFSLHSALQAMLPAFSTIRLDPPQPLPVLVPVDEQQRPIARPAGMSSFQRRVLRIEAPLRSLSLLMPEAVHMSWDRVQFLVSEIDQPSLRNSSVRVSLTGVLYEIADSPLDDGRVDGVRPSAGGRGAGGGGSGSQRHRGADHGQGIDAA